ncbi:MAG: hypothetical protein ACKVS8_14155 [Phycisphaerales bacterium]
MSAHTLDPASVAAFNACLLSAKHAALKMLADDLAFKPRPDGVNFERNKAAHQAAFAALRTPFIKLPVVSSPSGGGGRGSARTEGVAPAGGGAPRATDRRFAEANSRGSASESVPLNSPHLRAASASEPVPARVPPPSPRPLSTRELCRLLFRPLSTQPTAARRLLNRAGTG